MTALIETDSAHFYRQAAECHDTLNVWTKLYTVSETMLSAMRENRFLSALREICSNLLGCEQLAIIDISRAAGAVHFLAIEGLSSATRAEIAANGRNLETQIQPGCIRITSENTSFETERLLRLGVSALVPLWLDEESSGAMLLFQLLPQRSGFDMEDRQILQFLSTHAGQCLRSRDRG